MRLKSDNKTWLLTHIMPGEPLPSPHPDGAYQGDYWGLRKELRGMIRKGTLDSDVAITERTPGRWLIWYI